MHLFQSFYEKVNKIKPNNLATCYFTYRFFSEAWMISSNVVQLLQQVISLTERQLLIYATILNTRNIKQHYLAVTVYSSAVIIIKKLL